MFEMIVVGRNRPHRFAQDASYKTRDSYLVGLDSAGNLDVISANRTLARLQGWHGFLARTHGAATVSNQVAAAGASRGSLYIFQTKAKQRKSVKVDVFHSSSSVQF